MLDKVMEMLQNIKRQIYKCKFSIVQSRYCIFLSNNSVNMINIIITADDKALLLKYIKQN